MQEVGLSTSNDELSQEAQQILNNVANQRSYYGFLAADRVGRSYNLETNAVVYQEHELAELEKIPAIIRAYELLHLSMHAEGRREWRFAMRKMKSRQLELAAVLAHRWNWHDRAILTMAQTKHNDDLDLRFPMVFQKQVLSSAKRHRIDPAWVYGVVRQESAFMTDARSSAGAMGLMQLLPHTARLTARIIKMPMRSKNELYNAGKNIHLGSAYLRNMLDANQGHQVLATASYNAGPHRVKKWMPKKKLAADLWVEAIPFHETRGYVRSVMAFTTIFDKRLGGKVMRLSMRMPVISPKSAP